MNFSYILKKLLTSLAVLFIVLILNFFLPRIIFADPAMPYYAGIPEDQEALRAAIRAEHGFDKPLIVQCFIYLKNVFSFNFGISYIYKLPVFEVMFQRIPWSMILSLTSLILSVVCGIAFGAVAAKKRGKWQDNTILKLSTVTTAIPTFWIALVAVMLFSFIITIFPYSGAMTAGYKLVFNKDVFILAWLIIIALAAVLFALTRKALLLILMPVIGLYVACFIAVPIADAMDILYHSALPILVIVPSGIISYSLAVRNSMIAVVNEDYILTAKAKGLPPKKILYRHAFRNGLLPLVTSLGMSMAGIFGGSVLIEKIFSWPGMGQLLLEANNAGDFQLSQAIMLFYSIITIAANFITDLIYHKLDPRVGAA